MSDTGAAQRTYKLQNTREQKMWREVVTPEGATIRFRIADASERAGALMIDAAVMLGLLIVLFLVTVFSLDSIGFDAGGAIFLIFWFILRAGYFTIFEMGRRAATPGKRALKLRVVARDGRQLTANAIFARNAMRELEVFLPFTVLLGGTGEDAVSGWMTLCLIVWLGIFVLMPIFNKDKLRAGDLVAGTWVVRNPKLDLKKDISLRSKDEEDRYQFTQDHLQTYGEHELQVLEDVLRQSTNEVQKAVAERIRKRIGWESAPGETDRDFLEAFYKKLRQKLETNLLFGNRKKDKFDKGSSE